MRFSIITLGCKVNAYESQFYAKQLKEAGWEEDNETFDVVLINSCAVTNTAASKSRQMLHKAKRNNPNAYSVLIGCYAQVLSEEEKKAFDVDLIIGVKHKKEIVDILLEHMRSNQKDDLSEDLAEPFAFESMPIDQFESKHRAFLKVQDGCNQFCSYCIIPYARGRERSLSSQEVIAIAKDLEEKGHIEIVLTGIHTGRYYDEKEKLDLAGLLKKLLENTGEQVKYRISSIEITEVSDELIDLMKKDPRLLHHLHIPIQSGCDRTLKRMNRPYTVAEFEERLSLLRSKIPDLSISTDVICGFKQESEEEFQETLKTLERLRFSFLHVFPYSIRKGTAAEKMKGDVHGAIVKERVNTLLRLSDRLRKIDMERFDTLEVLLESKKGNEMHGYTNQYHPVIIKNDSLHQGRIYTPYTTIKDNVYIVE